MEARQTFMKFMSYETFVDDNMIEPIVTIGHDYYGEFIPDVSFWANGTVSFGTTYGFGSIVSTYPDKYRFPFSVMTVISSIYNSSPDKETFESLQQVFYDTWHRALPECVYEDIVDAGLGQCPISKDGVDVERLGDICKSGNYFAPMMEIEIGGATFFISMNGYVSPYKESTITFEDMKRLIHIAKTVYDIMHDGNIRYPLNKSINEIDIEEFEKLFSE